MRDVIQQLRMVPLSQLASKVYGRLAKEGGALFEALKDKRTCTYADVFPYADTPPIVHMPDGDTLFAHALSIKALADNHCQSIFTVLDSGWVNVSVPVKDHHARLKSEVTGSNYPESARILDILLNSPYSLKQGKDRVMYYPIDWQLDCKSGHRWDALKHYSEITYSSKRGSDIKVPWELGRFTHAPGLACAAVLSEQEESPTRSKEFYAHVFRTQTLDFMAFNPPRFGVQWKSSMDCGLRMINLMIAFDLFRGIGIVWDEEFSMLFKRSIYEHAVHILHHLEWSPTNRGNHYLANLAGLLFALRGLPLTDEHCGVIRFAIAEAAAEAKQQFYADGMNFEASLPYHGFSSEMLSLILAIASSFTENESERICTSPNHHKSLSSSIQPATPTEYKKALGDIKQSVHKAFEAMMRLQIDGLHLPNIGDNDSGYCMRITPSGSWVDAREAPKTYINLNPRYELPDVETLFPAQKAEEPYEWISDSLDCRPTLSMLSGALQMHLPESLMRNGAIEYQIISSIIQSDQMHLNQNILSLPFEEAYPRMHSFPAFGLWSLQHERYKAIMRAGTTGQKGKGGHAHNDQLSFVLSVDNEEFLGDPGTFWYTASPLMRNIGRSVTMHSTLVIPGREQNTWIEGAGDVLFWMKPDLANADGMFSEHVWRGIHHAYGAPHMRSLICNATGIKGHDSCSVEMRKIVQFHCVPGIKAQQEKAGTVQLVSPLGRTIFLNSLSGFAWEIIPAVYSRAYGRVEESTIIRMEVDAKTHDIHWEIKI